MKYAHTGKCRFASIMALLAVLICSIVVGAVFLAFDFYGSGASADTENSVTLADKWNAAITESKAAGSDADPVVFELDRDWIAQTDSNFVTSFGSGVGFSDGRLCVPDGAKIILNLNGKKIDRALSDKEAIEHGNVIYVVNGSLTVTDNADNEGLITGGNNANTTPANFNFGGGILVEGRGSLVFEGGTVSGNKANGGAGICVSNASFKMTGGIITGNTALDFVGDGSGGNGGGVAYMTAYYSNFEISGGTVSDNTAHGYGGGLYVASTAEFNKIPDFPSLATISGGEIKNNSADKDGGGIYVKGCTEIKAGVDINGSADSVVAVSGNKATNGGGVYVSDNAEFGVSYANINKNSASANYGGLYVKCDYDLTVSDSAVNENTATNGGGLYIEANRHKVTVSDSNANNNTAASYGGVYAGNSAALTAENCTVNDNTANTDYGGMYVESCDAFTMTNCKVNGNKATNGNGGGLYVCKNTAFTLDGMTAGETGGFEVKDNVAGKSYGGVFVDYSTCTFAMKGKIVISGNKANEANSNFYLQRDKIIKITGALEEGTLIYVSVENEVPYTFTSGFKANAGGKNPRDLFVSDINKGIILDGDEAQITTMTVLSVKPTLVKSEFEYDGKTHTVELNDFVEAGMTAEGLSGKDVREGDEYYTVVITLKDDYIWFDSTRDPVELKWQIVKSELSEDDVPVLTGDTLLNDNIIVYSVYEQVLKVAPLNHVEIVFEHTDSRLTVSADGTVKVPAKSPVGQYIIAVKPSYGYKWNGGGDDEIQLKFSIAEYDLITNWNKVISESLATGEEKRFVLTKDWTAQPDAAYTTSFGKIASETPNDKNTGFYYGRLCVPRGAKIILDLDGWTIDRNLTEAISRGQVFYIEGQLTVIDSQGKLSLSGDGVATKTGKITGGANVLFENGGGVYVDNFGIFVLDGGVITGNRAEYGGGVYVDNGGSFTLTARARIEGNTASVNGGGVYMTHISSKTNIFGGEITGNVAGGFGGGVYVDKGTFSMGGKVTVLENTADNKVPDNKVPDNIYLSMDAFITVTAALTGTQAGVYAYDKPCTFTRNYSVYNEENPINFFKPNYVNTISLRNGEAFISGRIVINKPALASPTSFVYRLNKEQGPTFDGFDGGLMAYGGTFKAVNASGDDGYTATVSLIDTEKYMWSDGTDTPIVIKWYITRINYNMTGVRWDYNPDDPYYTYDGTDKEVKLITANLPVGVSVESYTLNKEKNAGIYTATVTFSYTDHVNHNAPQVADCVWEIRKAKPGVVIPNPIEGKYFEGGKLSSVPIGGESSVEGVFTWTDESVTIGDATKEYSWTFTPNNVNYETVTGTIQFTGDNIIPLWKVIVIPLAVVVGIILLILIIVAIRRKSASRADYVYVSDDDDGFGDTGGFDDSSDEDYGSF